MRRYTTMSSRTAQPMHGHRTYIGPGSSTPGQATHGLVAAVVAERLRRAAYASCERAPMGWENER